MDRAAGRVALVWLLLLPPSARAEVLPPAADGCAGLLSLLAGQTDTADCGGRRLSRSAVEQRLDQACRAAAAADQGRVGARLRELSQAQACPSAADAAGHALCLLHPPSQQAAVERRLDRIRWSGYWRDPDDAAQCLLGLLRIGPAAAAAAEERMSDPGWGRDALRRLVTQASDGERQRLAPMLRALNRFGPHGLPEWEGRDDLYVGLCVAHQPAAPPLVQACAELGPEQEVEWQQALQVAEKRSSRPRLARRLLVTGGVLGVSGALLAMAATFRDSEAFHYTAVGAGVASGAALGVDTGLLVGALCGRDATSCSYEMIGAALVAAPVLALGGGIGGFYATREPGWGRFATLSVETAVLVPHALYLNWNF